MANGTTYDEDWAQGIGEAFPANREAEMVASKRWEPKREAETVRPPRLGMTVASARMRQHAADLRLMAQRMLEDAEALERAAMVGE